MSEVLVNNRRGNEVTETLNFVLEECCNCGIPFFMPKYHKTMLLNDTNKYFYCPNGHPQHYTGKSEEQKRIEELEAKLKYEKQAYTQMTDTMLDERNRANKLKRQLNRVHKGVCPCCNRSFVNLKRHMETKHPETK